MTSNKPVVTIEADPNKGIKVDVSTIAKPFREEIQRSVQQLKQQGIGTCV